MEPTTSLPELPAMPECVGRMQDTFRRDGVFVQTHCIVKWVLADQEGAPLFTDEHSGPSSVDQTMGLRRLSR